MDLFRLGSVPVREPFPGYCGRFVHSENMTLAYWEVAAGAPAPEHSHPHEQVLSLIEGEFEFTVAGEARVLEAGAVVVIPPGVAHSGRAVTACRIIDAFHPVRDDLR